MKIIIGVEILSIIWNALKLRTVMSMTSGSGSQEHENMMIYLVLELVVATIFFIVTITGIVKLLKWFRRAYFNLHLKIAGLKYAEWWAVASWFVPIVFFYGPYQIMKELHTGIDKLLEERQIAFTPTNFFRIRLWWAFWVVITALWILNMIRGFYDVGFFNETFIDSVYNITVSVLDVPAYFLTVKIIDSYAVKEKLLFELEQ